MQTVDNVGAEIRWFVYTGFGGKMALRDLTMAKDSISEQEIENIVQDYFRYDPDEGVIVLLPPARALSNRALVLGYLAALRGWPFVIEREVSVEATPAQIEAVLGIGGGTLRPILKSLKEAHFVVVKGRNYSLRPSAFHLVANEVKGGSAAVPGNSHAAAAKASRSPSKASARKKSNSRSQGAGTESSSLFAGWLGSGYFAEPRTLSDVHERFHDEGKIVPMSSIPSYLLKAVRKKQLRRKKQKVGSKFVWVYQSIPQ